MDATQVQPVEISGWDAKGQFFGEIAEMDTDETSGSSVRLCHSVQSGALLFVRAVNGANADGTDQKTHPVANEAKPTDLPDLSGRCRIQLTPCHPRDLRGRR